MSSNGTDKSVITCPHCNQRFSVVMPKTDLFNDLRVSVAVAPHEKPIRCLCGKYSVVAMQELTIAWNVIPLTDEQAAILGDSKIIIPPTPGMRLVN